jgi:hypothetical protein
MIGSTVEAMLSLASGWIAYFAGLLFCSMGVLLLLPSKQGKSTRSTRIGAVTAIVIGGCMLLVGGDSLTAGQSNKRLTVAAITSTTSSRGVMTYSIKTTDGDLLHATKQRVGQLQVGGIYRCQLQNPPHILQGYPGILECAETSKQ